MSKFYRTAIIKNRAECPHVEGGGVGTKSGAAHIRLVAGKHSAIEFSPFKLVTAGKIAAQRTDGGTEAERFTQIAESGGLLGEEFRKGKKSLGFLFLSHDF